MAFCPHCDELHDSGVDFCPRTGRPIMDVVERMIGRTIADKYLLKKSIGQGGMGTIFEASHTVIGNSVAVKLLHEPFANRKEPVERLYREARACGAIGHPNIIRIYDVGQTEENVPFLVMELLKGESLGDNIEREGPRSIGFALDVTIKMLSALHAAHQAGIIHRDLKSDNIFLLDVPERDEFDIKILDFGISKIVSEDAENLRLTQTGSVVGTPYYMSPEQASGKRDLDARVDIYAAGVILYEMLLGTIPHMASNYNALLIEIISDDVQPFRWRRPEVTEELESVVLTALSRNREDRWENALDFMAALCSIRDNLSQNVLNKEPAVQMRLTPEQRIQPTEEVQILKKDSRSSIPFAFESTSVSTFGRFRKNKTYRLLFWIAASFGMVLLLATGLYFMLSTGPNVRNNSGMETSNLHSPSIQNTSRVSRPSNAPTAQTLPERLSPPTVQLQVTKEPDSAIVWVDGELLSSSRIQLPKSSEPVTVQIRKEGYVPRSIQYVPESDGELNVVLVPVPKEGTLSSMDETSRLTKKSPLSKRKKKTLVKGKRGDSSNVSGTETKRKQSASLEQPMDNPF